MKSKPKKGSLLRYIILSAIFVLACLFYVVKLVNIQITGADYYVSSSNTTRTRQVVIQALRGEIYDRNGSALVTNAYTQTLQLDYNALPTGNTARNSAIAEVCGVLKDFGITPQTSMPIIGTYPNVSYDEEALSSSVTAAKFSTFLLRMNYKSNITCLKLYEQLLSDYGLVTGSGDYLYDNETQDLIIRVRYDLQVTNFAADNPYVLVKNASLDLITAVLEHSCRGIYIKKEFSRVYNYPGTASNILGRIGKIPAERLEEYLAQGYSYDAVVGLNGAEEAFETLLRGEDGIMVVEEDDYGNVINSYVKKEAVPGLDVYLTIDIGLQQKAEAELQRRIEEIVAAAVAGGQKNTGEDADSGALTVVNVNNGQVLALATYPSYDLSTFSENYAQLSTDEKKPLFDRSLFGSYQPGSTFKIATSVAALSSGTMTTRTEVTCIGKYTFYSDYQPSCWYKWGHGVLTISDAIGVSCNCFFFEAGRLTGINKLNEYCTSLGLGQYTGIELTESKGVLAGPDNAAEKGEIWNPGDTLQAAIGQSANAVTPLQLSAYIATVVNGGTRYKSTILYKTRTYSGSQETYNEPVVLNTVDISAEHLATIKQGMKNSKEWTVATKYYKFDVGSKTGTAQTTTEISNGVFTSFAPYSNPEIVVSCVIEKAMSGAKSAPAVFNVISYYYGLNEDGTPKTE